MTSVWASVASSRRTAATMPSRVRHVTSTATARSSPWIQATQSLELLGRGLAIRLDVVLNGCRERRADPRDPGAVGRRQPYVYDDGIELETQCFLQTAAQRPLGRRRSVDADDDSPHDAPQRRRWLMDGIREACRHLILLRENEKA